jgi:hypothetical protein
MAGSCREIIERSSLATPATFSPTLAQPQD